MSKIIRFRTDADAGRTVIEAEAREWLIRFDSVERPSRLVLRRFRRWLSLSPLHRQVFAETVKSWQTLDVWADRWAGPLSLADSHSHGWSPLKIVGATAFAMLIAFLVWIQAPLSPPPTDFRASYATRIGEIHALPLNDGSRVELNTQTQLAVHYDRTARTVRLKEGEAFFSVSPDPVRPFVIYAGHFAIEVLGTSFSVRVREGNRLDLVVTQGRVRLAALKSPPSDPEVLSPSRLIDLRTGTQVSAGERISVSDQEALHQTVSSARTEKELAWREGMLIFDNDRLDDVVARINRYTDTKIVIKDAGIRDLKFGGTFKVSDIPAILVTLNQNFGLRTDPAGDHLIYLSRR